MHKAYVVVGLGYGDEGKGAVTSSLALSLPSSLVVRYSGGSQCGHNVIAPDGRAHTFSQFGSGTLIPDSETHYSKHALFNPLNLIKEEEGLRAISVKDAFARFSVAESARVITPFHVEANRHREHSRGDAKHGTCAEGIGETMIGWLAHPESTVYARDLWDPKVLKAKLMFWRDAKRIDIEAMGERPNPTIFNDSGLIDAYLWVMSDVTSNITLHGDNYVSTQLGNRPVIFEGAQGVLLDENFGFHPHTTWSTTTSRNALDLIEDFDNVEVIGVTRSYMTRHGEGPFVTRSDELEFDEPHNDDYGPQGTFRQGHLDLVALKYAIEADGAIDSIALTHCDRIPEMANVCTAYVVKHGLEFSDGFQVIERLPLGATKDREHQEKLTRIVIDSIPAYTQWQGSAFLDTLEGSLGLPIRYRSSSPVMSDLRTTT